ncbi:MAG: nucleoid-associated protein [Leucothrix sp.]
MIDISNTTISKVIVHRIGNKAREEGYQFSPDEAKRTPTLDSLLIKSYLEPMVDDAQVYQLHHESDLALNTVYHYANAIFNDKESFKASTENIAKHLYTASTHPNIVGGEFITILFDGVLSTDGSEQALGCFKIEGRSNYLDIEEVEGTLSLVERIGISLDKVQKGALILSGGQTVHVIDSLSKKTKYWLETFLNAVPAGTPRVTAKAAGDFLKAVSVKVESPADAVEFGQKIEEGMQGADSLSLGELKEISKAYIQADEAEGIMKEVRGTSGLEMEDERPIDTKELKRYTRSVIRRTKIADGINLMLSGGNTQIASVDVEKTDDGLKAVIDILVSD